MTVFSYADSAWGAGQQVKTSLRTMTQEQFIMSQTYQKVMSQAYPKLFAAPIELTDSFVYQEPDYDKLVKKLLVARKSTQIEKTELPGLEEENPFIENIETKEKTTENAKKTNLSQEFMNKIKGLITLFLLKNAVQKN